MYPEKINNNFQITELRDQFPILKTIVHGKPLIYLDNAATTQKPQSVIDSISNYYINSNANIHRGVHFLSEAATFEYEESRKKVRRFINASSDSEIIFTRGTTESINLVAHSFLFKDLKDGDEIIITGMEHHSNIVPWQLLRNFKNITIKVIPIDDAGNLILDNLASYFTDKTKLLSVVYVSNTLGTINQVESIIEAAHKFGVPVLLDAAQAVNHIPIDVKKLDCDFMAFSGHKMYGPTGIGVLYGKEKILDSMIPYQGGGDMISKVTWADTTFNTLPYKFEAGTPNIEGSIGLGASIDFIESVGIESIFKHETALIQYADRLLSEINGCRLIGTAKRKIGATSFVLADVHPHDVGTFLDFDGIAIRTGHHCTQPIMDKFCIPATSRTSFAVYNTFEEIDFLAASVKKIIEVFK